ncbi:MAG TPA: peptidase T, partial [Candidatus Wallbacteria bacterium]|nr:peptidase T [Candidatus Wallbacteria bacterium]
IVKSVQKEFAGVKIKLTIKDQYQNMGVIIKKHPDFMKLTERAVKDAGLKPFYRAIRGGTDGARLTFMGIPTLNLFAGMFNPHSKNEWASVRAMEFAVKTIVNIAKLA